MKNLTSNRGVLTKVCGWLFISNVLIIELHVHIILVNIHYYVHFSIAVHIPQNLTLDAV